jgi:hypothetical protein
MVVAIPTELSGATFDSAEDKKRGKCSNEATNGGRKAFSVRRIR